MGELTQAEGRASSELVPAVAISTRNRPDALRRCLLSIGDGLLLPADVVVADQSDAAGTNRVVAEAGERGLPVRYIKARGGGLGAAQNDAFAATHHPIVAVVDDDCVVDDQWLRRIARRFESDHGLVLLGGQVLPLGPPAPDRYAVSSRLAAEVRWFSGKDVPWAIGSGNNFAVRRSRFEEIGGCDERLGPGAPLRGGLDMDLFYRLLRAGGRALYDPDVIVLHERTTREGRRSRRSAYGFGMAAATGIWLRQGDGYALRILASWVGMRTSLLARALARGRWESVYEETLVLQGTLQGLVRGLQIADTGNER